MNEKAALAWAFGQRDLAISRRFLLVAIVILAQEEAEFDFFVSRSAVLVTSGVSKRTIIRIFRELRASGLISRDPRKPDRRKYFGAARYRAACFEAAMESTPESRHVNDVGLGALTS